MKYCNYCAGSLVLQIPEGDDRERHVCVTCTTVHYENPRIITGCIPVYGDQVLLCKRAIEPRVGKWTLPAGFLENGETIAAGAARESWEEAHAKVEIDSLYTIYNLPYINQIYMLYRARLMDENFSPGIESLDVALFREEDIPWQEIAFRTVGYTLKHFFEDRRTNHFPLHEETMEPPVWPT